MRGNGNRISVIQYFECENDSLDRLCTRMFILVWTAAGPGFKPRFGILSIVGCYRINFLGGHRGFACILFKLRQATNHEFRAALRFVTGTYARKRMGWPDVPLTLLRSCVFEVISITVTPSSEY